MSNRETIQSATNIGVPKGENAQRLRESLETEGDIELPLSEFEKGKLIATSQGQTFWLLRGEDMVRRVQEGRIDVGAVGSDVVLDDEEFFARRLIAQKIGDPVCRFSLLAEVEGVDDIRRKLESDPRYPGEPLEFPTANATMLNRIAAGRDLPVRALDMKISGSVEAYARLTGLGRVADIVDTGTKSRANGLEEVCKLCDIYPELIMAETDENL